MKRAALAGWILLAAPVIHAQSPRDTSATKLEPVVVSVTRGPLRSVLGSPFAITIVNQDSTRPGLRRASVDEALAMVPGLAAINRNNPAQDPRVSIRGFGSRSAFGVRGVRILRDGIPLTLPDGQTPVDYLSLESTGLIEVLRGAASALYGNASGGVIDIHTRPASANAVDADLKHWFGDDGRRTSGAASGTAGGFTYVTDAILARSDGSRAHSMQRSATGFVRIERPSSSGRIALTAMLYDNPLSENPGALTLDEMLADPSRADPLSVRRNARKSVRQAQVGVTSEHAGSRGRLSLSLHGGARTLDNPLTFAIVDVGRQSYGFSALAEKPMLTGNISSYLTGGMDLQWQLDRRQNFATCADTVPVAVSAMCPVAGRERGVVTLNQLESVLSSGFFLSSQTAVGDRIIVTAGARADNLRFKVEDRLVSGPNPDDSGFRSLFAISPIASLLFRAAPAHSIYAGISTAFETPTATELGNQPDGSAGLNQDLDPQHSVTAESGAKGTIRNLLSYDVAMFQTRVRDELVPFEISGGNGRRYFRNAGRTSRRGVETALNLFPGNPVSVAAVYSFARFRFEDYSVGGVSYRGKQIPGIPPHHLRLAIVLANRRHFGVVEFERSGSAFVDDANSVATPGHSIANVRAGTSLGHRAPRFSLTAAIDNLHDRRYAGSIAVNAARGRYYEPARPRTIRLGMGIGTGHATRR